MGRPANGHGRPGHNSGSLWLSRSYNFIDKDPEIDKFRTLWQKERIKETDLADLAGLSPSTVHNMFGGQTRRPAHATFAKMAGAMGFKYELQRDEAPNYDRQIPKAKEQRKEYQALLKKRRARGTKKK